jgi:hypothetical protein
MAFNNYSPEWRWIVQGSWVEVRPRTKPGSPSLKVQRDDNDTTWAGYNLTLVAKIKSETIGKLLSRFHGHSFKGSPQLKFVISEKHNR